MMISGWFALNSHDLIGIQCPLYYTVATAALNNIPVILWLQNEIAEITSRWVTEYTLLIILI